MALHTARREGSQRSRDATQGQTNSRKTRRRPGSSCAIWLYCLRSEGARRGWDICRCACCRVELPNGSHSGDQRSRTLAEENQSAGRWCSNITGSHVSDPLGRTADRHDGERQGD